YFLSPFLSLLLKKYNKYLVILFVTIFLIFSQFLGQNYHIFDSGFMFFHFSKSPYLHIYFIHTYLFFCGMLFQNLGSFEKIALATKFKLSKYRYITFSLLLYIALVYTFLEKHLLTSLPLMGSLVLLFIVCAYALENEISSVNLLTSAVTFIGNHSLPIYLFHMSFYFLLDKIDLIETDSFKSMLIVVSLFPLFIIFSLSLEKFSTVVSNRLRKAI
ncbi:MAG: acyltransferase family protein, partial [Cyanobacteria bacterium P01_G01_bin.49]